MQRYFLLLAVCAFVACSSTHTEPRINEDFNFGWKFHLGEVENGQAEHLVDLKWQDVRLPHDWSVALSFTQENAAGATAFLPGGIGWYRKTFDVPASHKNKITWVEFDGVYSNSEVWINGQRLGKRPYGYIPFKYDVSKYLKYGDKNVIAVRVDRSAYVDCRWYPGSGIYRNVKLVTVNKLHIPQWGVFVTSPKVSTNKALVKVETDLINQFAGKKNAMLKSTIYFEGKEITSSENEMHVLADQIEKLGQELNVPKPHLWDTEHPQLYQLLSEVYVDGQLVDKKKTTFGIRQFYFDKDKGFFLNGKNRLLKGVCLHHDGGLVGAAVPDGVWQRRLQKLKDAGCNAIRTAHNPPSESFLNLCDRMGFFVQDEAFDEWNNPKDKRNNYNQAKAEKVTRGYTEHFTEWSERDIKSMVARDRNHPSVIMWSIGNEIEWTYPRYGNATGYWGSNKVGDINYYWDEPPFSVEKTKANFDQSEEGEYVLANTAKNLSKWVKEEDTSRPVTANLVMPTVSNFSGYADALDIVGLSYRAAVYDYCKRNYPDKVFLGTENWARQHEWQPVLDKPFISGIFLWTGIDYMGESRNWPSKGSGSGLLNFAGFEKPSYHMFKSLWNKEPEVYITTQVLEKSPYKWDANAKKLIEKEAGWAAHQKWGWQSVNEHWNYTEGDKIAVEVYTNQEEVELFLNGKSLGIQKLKDNTDHILKWLVPYAAGKLTAKALGSSATQRIETATALKRLVITADKKQIVANAYDVVHFTVQLTDGKGNPIKHEDKNVVFDIDGDARLLGVDNGSSTNVQDYQNNELLTSKGRCLMVLQSNLNPSTVKVKAVCEGVESKTVEVLIK